MEQSLHLSLDDDCLLLDGIPVLWPEGTTWNPSAEAVRLSNGDLAAMGDSVIGGGGFYGDLQDVSRLFGSDIADSARPCIDSTGQVAVFNLGSDVTLAG